MRRSRCESAFISDQPFNCKLLGMILCRNPQFLTLMAEMTNPRKNHRQTQAVSCFDDFLVPDRSSWLNNGSRTGSGNFFHSVGEGEKGIGGSYRPMQRKYGLHRSDFAGIHTRHL